jgi:hypothetical protein
LDSFGFPWILSSESRLINGLRGKNEQTIFHVVSSVERGAAPEPAVELYGTAELFIGQA